MFADKRLFSTRKAASCFVLLKLIFGLTATATLLVSAASVLLAQELSSHPVRIIVPFASAGYADRIARVIASEMSEAYSQRAYVENKPGAGGLIGSAEVTRAAPDGTTLLISAMPTLVIAPLINPTDNFRPVENFSQIAYIGGPPVAFVTSSSSEIKSFDALLRIAKDRPLNYGTGGVGTVGHLTAAYVAHKANVKLTHIPYNGPMIGDIISGVVDFGSLTASTVLGNIDGGTLRGLAIGTDKRLPTHPEIPTFKELGFDLSPIAWLSIAGPPDMPRELQITLNKEITNILGRPKVKDILKQEMIEPVAMSPQELTAFVRSEITTWTPIVELAGLRK
jgi:tripartite-type tricarboxylate transporter receptor subunit TctC